MITVDMETVCRDLLIKSNNNSLKSLMTLNQNKFYIAGYASMVFLIMSM